VPESKYPPRRRRAVRARSRSLSALEARAARALVEAALDALVAGRGPAAWPWLRRLSLWVDALVLIEESST
jgi:hypothetical protein